LLAVPYILVLWGLLVFYRLIGRADLVIPFFALLVSVPLYMVLNLAGQKLLNATFGPVEAPGDTAEMEGEGEKEGEDELESADQTEEMTSGAPDIHRFIPMIRRGLSISIGGIIFFWVLHHWGFDLPIGRAVTKAAFQILIAISFTYAVWKFIERAINRRLEAVQGIEVEDDDAEMGGAGGSRIGTLLQLLRKFLLAVFLTMVTLIILSSLGVNIGPLLAGAGVAGLAIGFGAQTLVKDIISGVFYLIDDAFRIGDYVDTGSLRGTVERLSIRSVRLRHHLGMVHTIPFGELGSVTNYSRDYIIMKIEFRVPFDTDIEQVRKIVKKINKEIEKDKELGSKLLSPIKSQGVKALDDSAMIMRIKYKTVPGGQFVVRKEVYKRLQQAFEEKGIEFASRAVVVRLPEDVAHQAPATQRDDKPKPEVSVEKKALPAGAAAAIASALAKEEEESERKEDMDF
jgi:small-conductance mechanosensitive channel